MTTEETTIPAPTPPDLPPPENQAAPPGAKPEPSPEQTDRALRRQLMAELEALVERLQALTAGSGALSAVPPGPSELAGQEVKEVSPGRGWRVLKRLGGAIGEDWFDLDTWKGLWYMVNSSLEYQGDIIKRRFSGDYETDAWGLDWEFLEVVRPFLTFLYKAYWRVETGGLAHIPEDGPALLVGNHAGQSPWEGMMVTTALWTESPAGRLVRSLHPAWFATLPFLSAILVKMGHAVGSIENSLRLLEQDELVAVYPDGYAGRNPGRDHAAAFGWEEIVRLAGQTGAPIIPMAIIGAEETYAALGRASLTTRLTGRAHPILSPGSAWFKWFSFLPPPLRWSIDFGEPILVPGDEPETVSQLTAQLRTAVETMRQARLAGRRLLPLG